VISEYLTDRSEAGKSSTYSDELRARCKTTCTFSLVFLPDSFVANLAVYALAMPLRSRLGLRQKILRDNLNNLFRNRP
jgi:hypothetical protein